MDLVANLPIAVNIMEYVFYTGAASDDIEFNFYANSSREVNFTDVLADSNVPTNLRGCLLQDGRVLFYSGQFPLVRRGRVRKSLGISRRTAANGSYFIFERHTGSCKQCIYMKMIFLIRIRS